MPWHAFGIRDGEPNPDRPSIILHVEHVAFGPDRFRKVPHDFRDMIEGIGRTPQDPAHRYGRSPGSREPTDGIAGKAAPTGARTSVRTRESRAEQQRRRIRRSGSR